VADHVNPETRSRIMAAVHSKNTKPELAVRKIVHSLGYRYRLHVQTLPGKPDLVFPARRKILFVHGCYWHRHRGCRYATSPKTNVRFWQDKFSANIQRDRRNVGALKKLGWAVMTIWQCQLKNPGKLGGRIDEFLSNG
jgi:DNA mismatch endonuclease (patch repair protein)